MIVYNCSTHPPPPYTTAAAVITAAVDYVPKTDDCARTWSVRKKKQSRIKMPSLSLFLVDICREYARVRGFSPARKGIPDRWLCIFFFLPSPCFTGSPPWFPGTIAGRGLGRAHRRPSGKQYISRYINRTYYATLRTGREKKSTTTKTSTPKRRFLRFENVEIHFM